MMTAGSGVSAGIAVVTAGFFACLWCRFGFGTTRGFVDLGAVADGCV
jgi:hypothetical protein